MEAVVHLGFPKTATTTLQVHLFQGHSEIAYIGKPFKEGGELTKRDERKWIQDIYANDSISFNQEASNQLLSQILSKKPHENRKLLVSEEHFSYPSTDTAIVASRLMQSFDRVKIMITIRRQQDLLVSWYYYQMAKKSTHPKYSDINHWLSDNWESFEYGYFPKLQYMNLIEIYKSVLGPETPVGIFLFEEFIQDLDSYSEKLSRFLEINNDETRRLINQKVENKRVTERRQKFNSLQSKYFFNRNIMKILPAHLKSRLNDYLDVEKLDDQLVQAHWIEKIQALYAEGNKNLGTEFNLPLSKYGYV